MSKLKKFWLCLWQLPQNIVGVVTLVKMDDKCVAELEIEGGASIYKVDGLKGFLAYGDLFFVNKYWNNKHVFNAWEKESKLSRILGWFYLPWCGIKSIYNKKRAKK